MAGGEFVQDVCHVCMHPVYMRPVSMHQCMHPVYMRHVPMHQCMHPVSLHHVCMYHVSMFQCTHQRMDHFIMFQCMHQYMHLVCMYHVVMVVACCVPESLCVTLVLSEATGPQLTMPRRASGINAFAHNAPYTAQAGWDLHFLQRQPPDHGVGVGWSGVGVGWSGME